MIQECEVNVVIVFQKEYLYLYRLKFRPVFRRILRGRYHDRCF